MSWLTEADPRSQSVRLRLADALSRLGAASHLDGDEPGRDRDHQPRRGERRGGDGERAHRDQPRRRELVPG